MLLGTGSGGNVPNPVAPVTLDKYYAFYGQDRWHVNRRLTLTLGLRYEIQLPRTTRYNRQNWFDFGIRNPISDDVGMDLRGGLVFASPSERGQTELDHWNMAPRLGFAYKVTDRLVMRGGYGISYMRSNGKGGVTGTEGYSVTSQWVPSVGGDGINPLNLLSNPFPNGFDKPTGASLGALTQIGRNVRAFNHNNPSPYLQSYSLDFQYELTQGSVFEIGYTGNVGRKLNYGYNPNWNQMHPSFLSLGESLNDPVANSLLRSDHRRSVEGRDRPEASTAAGASTVPQCRGAEGREGRQLELQRSIPQVHPALLAGFDHFSPAISGQRRWTTRRRTRVGSLATPPVTCSTLEANGHLARTTSLTMSPPASSGRCRSAKAERTGGA